MTNEAGMEFIKDNPRVKRLFGVKVDRENAIPFVWFESEIVRDMFVDNQNAGFDPHYKMPIKLKKVTEPVTVEFLITKITITDQDYERIFKKV